MNDIDSVMGTGGDWLTLVQWVVEDDPMIGPFHIQFHWDWHYDYYGIPTDKRVNYTMWTLDETSIAVAEPLPTWWILAF